MAFRKDLQQGIAQAQDTLLHHSLMIAQMVLEREDESILNLYLLRLHLSALDF